LLAGFATVAALLVLITMLTSGRVAVASVVAIGLFNSIMFPNIFTFGIEKLGPLTGRASSLLVMAIVGGAIIPLAQGTLADTFGVHHAFILPLLCYLYIVFYALNGSRTDRHSLLARFRDASAHG
ncbi:MAG: glucose/galactose MFS transporter, partial [Gammaproteobacteria bacterium]